MTLGLRANPFWGDGDGVKTKIYSGNVQTHTVTVTSKANEELYVKPYTLVDKNGNIPYDTLTVAVTDYSNSIDTKLNFNINSLNVIELDAGGQSGVYSVNDSVRYNDLGVAFGMYNSIVTGDDNVKYIVSSSVDLGQTYTFECLELGSMENGDYYRLVKSVQ